jgi:hypothetical protein
LTRGLGIPETLGCLDFLAGLEHPRSLEVLEILAIQAFPAAPDFQLRLGFPSILGDPEILERQRALGGLEVRASLRRSWRRIQTELDRFY